MVILSLLLLRWVISVKFVKEVKEKVVVVDELGLHEVSDFFRGELGD